MERTETQAVNKNDANAETASVEEVRNGIKNICSSKEKLNKFIHFTLLKINGLFNEDNIKGDNAQDTLQNIFEKFLLGKRKWYKIDGRTFENQLIMTITSFIRNEYKKYFGTNDPTKGNLEKTKTPKIFRIYGDDGKTIEQYLKDESQDFEAFDRKENEINKIDMEVIIKKFYSILEDDEEAFLVFDELLKVGNSDIKVAKSLGMPIEDVRKVKKRIRRKKKEILILN